MVLCRVCLECAWSVPGVTYAECYWCCDGVFQVPVHQTLKELLILRAELQRRVEELQREASSHSLSSSSEHSHSPTHTPGTPLHTAVWHTHMRNTLTHHYLPHTHMCTHTRAHSHTVKCMQLLHIVRLTVYSFILTFLNFSKWKYLKKVFQSICLWTNSTSSSYLYYLNNEKSQFINFLQFYLVFLFFYEELLPCVSGLLLVWLQKAASDMLRTTAVTWSVEIKQLRLVHTLSLSLYLLHQIRNL